MKIFVRRAKAAGVKITVRDGGRECGRAYLYLLRNDLHEKPFGLMEDVYVEKSARGQGIGTHLVKAVIMEAKQQGCYKLIATSRYSRRAVHALYRRLGFTRYGIEFRIDL